MIDAEADDVDVGADEDAVGRWADDGGSGPTAADGDGVAVAGDAPQVRFALRLKAATTRLSHLEQAATEWSLHLPVVALMFAYAAHFGVITVDTLRSYQQDAYDMAIADQGIWLMSRFHAPFVTVMGKNMFGDHTSFIFVLLVPLDWVYPHTAALLVLQAMAVALGALPVYLLARHLLKSTILATLLAAAYLLNPALQQGNLEQFHVEAFEAPLLGFAIYAAVVWRPKLLVVLVFLLLMCKQDDALYVLPLGLWVTWRRQRQVGATIFGLGVLVAAIDNFLVVPILMNGIPTTYGGWIPFGGMSAAITTLIRRPGQFWAYAISQGRPWYLWQMVFSTGLLSLMAPGVLAIALPELAFDTLSDFGYQHQILRHYSMPLVAILMCASAYAIARAPSAARRVLATVGVTLCALWSCVLWGDLPFSDSAIPTLNPNVPAVEALNQLVKLIPPNAVVSAAENLVPNLDHRKQIYMFPTPFSQSYYGNPENDGRELPFATQVQYILLPSCISCDGNLGPGAQAVFDQFAGDFRVEAQADDTTLYERKGT
jgi:uncharacterized membrane protein